MSVVAFDKDLSQYLVFKIHIGSTFYNDSTIETDFIATVVFMFFSVFIFLMTSFSILITIVKIPTNTFF